MFKRLFIFGLIYISSLTAHAKVFRNSYISFELMETWKCDLEQTVWVCRTDVAKDAKDAIIIFTAKEVGPTDSFAQYSTFLGKPRVLDPKNPAAVSKVMYAPKQIQVNDHPWIDGLQMGAEVPNYFTRYVVTIKDKIAILVTFSAHKDRYTKYSQDFYKAIMSLRVIATKDLLGQNAGAMRPGDGALGPGTVSAAMPTDLEGATEETGGGGGGGQGSNKMKFLLLGIAGLLGVFAILFMSKSRKK
jgi:hypothetical protein